MKDWKQASTRKAFIVHLALSLLIFSTLVFTMLFFWYPGELFFIDGGWQGLKLVAMVDIVLGPAMTLFLFKPGKKSLVFDMSVIAAIQIAALAYGFYATYQQRTVAIVYSDEGFNTLSAAAHTEANLILIEKEKTPKHISDITDNRPALLGTELVTKETYGKYLADLLNNYPEPHERSDKFVDLSKNIDNMLLQSMDENDINHHANGEKIAAALKKLDRTVDDTQILNFRARYAKGVLLFDAKEQEILDFVPNKKYTATTADSDGD